jgi:predicted dehydrogenase
VSEQPVRLLVVGTGSMANQHAEQFAAIPGVTLVAGIDNNPERLAAFNAKHKIARGFASVAEAIAWGEFDAVTNVTPDAVHHATTLPFLAAGKHVMCEKPLAANYPDAAEMAEAATRAGTVNMVNLTYRNGGGLMHAARLVAEGAIGTVRHFEASYLQSWLTQSAWGEWDKQPQWLWRLSTAHGSMGVLGDIGVHILDFTSLIANAMPARVSCRLKTFDKAPGGKIGEYVLDANDSALLHLEMANGSVGVLHASRMATGHLNDLTVRIHGTKGGLLVTGNGRDSAVKGCLGEDMKTATWKDIDFPPVQTNYQRFIAAIRAGRPADPDFARGAALQKVLDLAVESDRQGMVDLAV